MTPFDQLGNNAIAETTNFYIDLNGTTPVICCEFNNLGPRISDIEFYFRTISSHRMLYLSKACKAQIHMNSPINEVLDSISDVLQLRVKTRPNRLNYLYQQIPDSFISNMNGLASTLKPQSLKIDAFFRERGTLSNKSVKNTGAIILVKKILNAVKINSDVIEDFDDFYLEFEKDDGTDAIFSLVKGKEEIEIECPFKSPGNLDTKELYNKAVIEFQEYLSERRK